MRRPTPPLLIVAILALSSGCPSFYPQVAQQTAPGISAKIEFVEGNRDELVLRVVADDAALVEATVLELYRFDGDEPILLQQVLLDPPTKLSLSTGIEFVDTPPGPGELEYIVTTNAGPTGVASVHIRWDIPPLAPTDVSAEVALGAVIVSWGSGAGTVFRRDVIRGTEQILGEGIGRFIDTSVADGDVFTYQVSRFRPVATGRHYGPFSEPLYVTVETR